MKRRFLNLVMENLDTNLYALRRLNLASHLFYPSTAAAEAGTARTEAAVKANAERQDGYRHGRRFLQATASVLDPLPAATIHFKPGGPSTLFDVPLDLVALLGDESRILCADTTGRTSLYDVESHAIVTVPDLRACKGSNAIPICVARDGGYRAASGDGGYTCDQGGSLYVLSRSPDPKRRDQCFEELRYVGGRDVFSPHQLNRGWTPVPPPPFLHLSRFFEELCGTDINAYTVVGGSTIYVSSFDYDSRGFGTYAFDTTRWQWRHAGEWTLPFYGRAEFVPELGLWFGLSNDRPHHLCAADLSTASFERPPEVLHSGVDLDMPKAWKPFRLDLVNLGSGRFCVAKMFRSTEPRGQSDEDDSDEAWDFPDVIGTEFAVLTGVEVVRRCDGELRMIKHMSRYHMFKDDLIHWVL